MSQVQNLWGVVTPVGRIVAAYEDQALAATDADLRNKVYDLLAQKPPEFTVKPVQAALFGPADNPASVKVGQVWRDNDKRMDRTIQVLAIEGRKAVVARTPMGIHSRIRLSRFATDFSLVSEAP